MNTITAEQITSVLLELNDKITLEPAAIAYLQLLLTPYAEAIAPASIESLRLWLPHAFKRDLFDLAIAEMNNVIEGILRVYTTLTETTPEVENAAKVAIMKVPIQSVIHASLREASENGSDTIWPWDIQAVLSSYGPYQEMFGVLDGDEKLPVDITVGPQKFTHEVSDEFVAGLLVFNSLGANNIDVPTFDVTMFDIPFLPSMSRFLPDGTRTSFYTVTVNNIVYMFDSPEFMQGFATGALWGGVDHHTYWKDLTYDGNDVTF